MNHEEYEQRGYLVEDFRLFHLRDEEMRRVAWHYHNFHKIIFFLSGDAAYDIEGQRYILEPGDILLVGRGDIHRPEVAPNTPYERVVLYISNSYLHAHSNPNFDLSWCFKFARREFRFVLRPDSDTQIPALLKSLENSLSNEGFGQELLSKSIFMQLLIEVSRSAMTHNFSYAPSAVADEKVVAILRYLNDNLTRKISIDDLASQFYISKFYMMRRFRDETGSTIHSYLNNKRLLLARELIAGGMPITDACYQSGFQDYSTFSRAYKKQFKHTPKQT